MSVNNEKLLSPLFPLGGRAVITNDWCIASHINILMMCIKESEWKIV